jgi:hypothetical protein
LAQSGATIPRKSAQIHARPFRARGTLLADGVLMTLRASPFLVSAAAVLAVFGSARVAYAGECAVDDDCGHGYECETLSSGTGGAGGTSGSGASVGGTSSAGTSGFAPPREVTCGDGLCQVPETIETCASDCANTVCVLAECESTDDCADGYECEEEPIAGTGGTAGAACGDGLCTSGETEETCAVDCTVSRRCSPAREVCSSDEQCAEGFYCSLGGSGSGGSPGSGSGGFSGTSGSSSGGAAPATGGASSGGTGSSVGGTSQGADAADPALAAGTCLPEEGGAGGTSGSGGSIGSGAAPGTGGVGGSGFAGSGAVGVGGSLSTGGTSGSSGTGNGGTGTGSGGTGAGATGGSGAATGAGGSAAATGAGGSTAGAGSGNGGSESAEDEGTAEHGGCSIAVPQGRSSFAEFGAFLLVALSVLGRRRRG